MSDKRLYLIDATAFCYRAFYALSGLTTSFGQPTNAVYGFVSMLNKILKEKKPEYLVVCFDVSRDTFRQKKFAEYKIQRPPMPEGLSSQLPLIKEIISAYGIAILEKEGYEADDIIATLARKAKENGLLTTIISSDKDILQLVDERTAVFSPYKDEGTLYNKKKVLERFSAKPSQIPDLIALMGDAVDNIPGAKGVGEKTAIELIKEFGSVKNLFKNIEGIKQERLKKIIKENLEQITLSRELAVLDKDIAIDFDLEKIKISLPDYQELFRLFKRLEFKTLLNGLPQEAVKARAVKLKVCKDEELKSLSGESGELFLYGERLGDLVFYAQDKFFRVDKSGPNLEALLVSPKVKKISYDFKKLKISLAKEKLPLTGVDFDVMLAAYLLNPSQPGYSLTDIAWDYLEKAQSQHLDSREALDLIIQLRPKLEKELREKSLLPLFNNIEMPLVEVLARMELTGIKLDLEVLKRLSEDLEKRLIKLIEDIYEISGVQFNINSPKQLRDILFERLKLPVVKRSKTGPSTDEEVLRALADKHKLPALLLEYRQLMKLKTTYIDVLPELVDPKTGRIHTSFNQAATETGRLSSTNPNLQNIPVKTDVGRQIRRAIVASGEDNYLLSCDYSQIELRILAHLCRDERLTSAFKEGRDVHKITAALIYGLSEKDVTEAMREVAKRINFGIIYGLSAYGLARDLKISAEQAQGFIDAYFLRYPRVKEYVEEQTKIAQKNGFVTTISGRRRYLPEINNKNQAIRQMALRQAVNTPVQGSAADLIKLAMIQIHRQLETRRLKTEMILQIHDELVFDVPESELAEAAGLIRDRMENVLELNVPVKVDIKKGKNWLEMEDM
ncbi:MAG: DNA polymerase I [Candidatus Omnitrophota bacterium]|jgi:DNA polymerase-1